MKFNRKFLIISFTVLLLIALVWDIFLYLLPEKTTTWNYLYNAVYGSIDFFGSIVLLIYGINYGLKSNLGKTLVGFGLSFLLFSIGQAIFIYYNFVLHVEIPYPSWADVAYVADFPFMVLGVFFLVRIYQQFVTRKLILVSSVTALLAFIIIFVFFARPDLSAGVPLVQKFLNLYYPSADAIAIILAVIALQIGGGKLYHSLYFIALGLVLSAAGDLIYTYKATAGTYWVGDIPDLLYALDAYLIIVGLIEIIHSMQQAEVKVEKPNEIS
jgi:hypothetical protein